MSKRNMPAYPKQTNGMTVHVVNNNIEKALAKFKRLMKETGVLDEYRERQEYTKPSTKRRMALNRAKRKQRQDTAQQNRFNS